MSTTIDAGTELHAIRRIERAVGLLSRRWTTRVIDEIDDFGPIPRTQSAAALPDIPTTRRGYVLRALEQRGLLTLDLNNEHEQSAYTLTDAAQGLGEVYDSLHAWARTHLPRTAGQPYSDRVEAALACFNLPAAGGVLTALGSGPRPRKTLVGQVASAGGRHATRPGAEAQLDVLVGQGLIEAVGPDDEQIGLASAGTAALTPLAALSSWAEAHSDLTGSTVRRTPAAVTARAPAREPATASVRSR